MRKRITTALFEKDFINSLVEDESSCVEVQEQNYHLALHPFHLNNINESLKDILNQGIAKYDKKLDGILLGYQNIKLLSQSGAVTNDSYFIHIDIAASFFLFKPEVGKILSGIVNKKSKDHVACLVHKTFNVSLPKPEDVEDGDWMGTKVGIEQEILFRITFVNLEARLPYIRAEFVAILGEQDSGISTGEENVEKMPNKANRKPTKIVFESNSDDEDNQTTKKKKKKKRKKREDSENEEQEQEKKKRKKHKHKLSSVENLDLVDGNTKKKSKHKDLSGILELEVDEEYDHKKKKRKRKNRSHEAETDIMDSNEHDAHTKKKEKILTYYEEDHSNIEKKKKHKVQSFEDEYLTSEKRKKKKKSKEKQDLEEVVDLEGITKKKKKSKHKTSLEDQTSVVLQRTLLSFSENQSKEEQKTIHKKERKNKKRTNISDDLNTSLPELNLSHLLGKSVSNKATPTDNFQMADNEDKISKKRRSSTSHANFWDSNTELMADSDLEKIIQDVDKSSNHKHRKEGGVERPTKLTKKRRQSSSSDDFVKPVPKKKHKKNL